jgi:hypothetical protein
VDGYRQAREYIVTEWPLPETISYLWSLVYDYDASAVVVLSNPDASSVICFKEFKKRIKSKSDYCSNSLNSGQKQADLKSMDQSLPLTTCPTIIIQISRVGSLRLTRRYNEIYYL